MKELIVILVLVGLISIGLIAVVKEDRQQRMEFEAFKVQHHCQIVAKKDGSIHVAPVLGTDAKGNSTTSFIISSTPSQTGWKCDDGVTYWKND